VRSPLNCLGYEDKTLYFKSDTSGDLTIEVDPVGDGDWETLDIRTGITSEIYKTTHDFTYMRLTFSVAATVTAKLVARRSVGWA